MKIITSAVLLVFLLAGCDGFVGDVRIGAPAGAPIAVVDPEYLVLRAIAATPGSGSTAATVHGQTVYYDGSSLIMDLYMCTSRE